MYQLLIKIAKNIHCWRIEMKTKFVGLIWLFTLWLVACGPTQATPVADSRPIVVATNSILGNLTQQIGGEGIQLTILVGANGDSHTFQPSPADSAALASANLIIENGLGLESWLDELYESAGATGRRVIASEGIEPISLTEEEHDHDEEGAEHDHDEEGAEHDHGQFDPHVWHDVTNVIQMVQNITAALVAADPDQATTYQANSDNYIVELETLDSWIFEQVALIPAGQRKLVTSHDTFAYFAARYQFQIIGTVLNAGTTEAGDPSAGEMAALIETIRAANVPAIFTENISNPQLAEQIAAEANAQLAPPLFSDALGESGSAGDTYLKMMRYNVSTIVEALR